MVELNRHWTSASTDDFLYRIGADFVQQLEEIMQSPRTNQAALAKTLGVTEGRVSQVLNNPGNLTLRKIIEYARALKKKVSIVTYDDDDPLNQNGPINPQVFVKCWERAGMPSDFLELDEGQPTRTATNGDGQILEKINPYHYSFRQMYGANQSFRCSSVPGPLMETDTSATNNYKEATYGRNEANSL